MGSTRQVRLLKKTHLNHRFGQIFENNHCMFDNEETTRTIVAENKQTSQLKSEQGGGKMINCQTREGNGDEWETTSVVIGSTFRRTNHNNHRREIFVNFYDSVAVDTQPEHDPTTTTANILTNKRNGISLVEKLIKTERIWYLPNLGVESIGKLLANKPCGNFILSYRKSDEATKSNNTNEPRRVHIEKEPADELSAILTTSDDDNNNNKPLLIRTRLVLYVSSNRPNTISEHSIWVEPKSHKFSIGSSPRVGFKSIMSLFEYYLLRSSLSPSTAPPVATTTAAAATSAEQHPQKQQQLQHEFHFKLTLPAAIEHASHSQQLNSLSLLEKDFWIDKFYSKFASTALNINNKPPSGQTQLGNNNNNNSGGGSVSRGGGCDDVSESFVYPATSITTTNTSSSSSSTSSSKASSPELNNISAATKNTVYPNLSRIPLPPKPQQQQQQRPKQQSKFNTLDLNYLLKSSSNNLLTRMQQWQSRLFGSQLNKLCTTATATTTSSRREHQQSSHQPINDFVSQLIESQTNTPRLEVKRNSNNNYYYNNTTHLAAHQPKPNLSSLIGTTLFDHSRRKKPPITTTSSEGSNSSTNHTDNQSIVSSCISFLDDHLSQSGAHINNKLFVKMETTNEYSEPFDYFTSLPTAAAAKKQSSLNMAATREKNDHNETPLPLVLLSSSLSPTSSSASPSSSSSSASSSPSTSTTKPATTLKASADEVVKQQQQQQQQPLSSQLQSLLPPLTNEYECVRDIRVIVSSPPPPPARVSTTEAKPSQSGGCDGNDNVAAAAAAATEKSVEDIKSADTDLFKSTITAFDILSERCSELLGLFENETEISLPATSILGSSRQREAICSNFQKTKTKVQPLTCLPPTIPPPPPPVVPPPSQPIKSGNTNKDELSSSISSPKPSRNVRRQPQQQQQKQQQHQNKKASSSHHHNYNHNRNDSKFLERTLTFDCHIKSSALLYSSSSPYLSMMPTTVTNGGGGSSGDEEAVPANAKNAVASSSSPEPPLKNNATISNSSKSTSSSSSTVSSTYSFDDATATTTPPTITHNQQQNHSRSFNSIRTTIFRMAKNEKCLFGKNVVEFLACTHKSREQNPLVLMSNTRQFMNGIKNYLIRNLDSTPSSSTSSMSTSMTLASSGGGGGLVGGAAAEAELKMLIERERASLDPTQILNLDSILEDCLQCIVLRPLKARIYYLLVDHLVADHSLILMSKSIKLVCDWEDTDPNLCSKNLSLKSRPSDECLKRVRDFYTRMQCEYAPLVKLKYVLFIVNELLHECPEFEPALVDFASTSATLLLPPIIYALAKCGMYAFQIELEYIWSLANRQLLTAETLFYLTLMSSACFILRSLEPSQFLTTIQLPHPPQSGTSNTRMPKCIVNGDSFELESSSLSSSSGGSGSWSSSSSSSSSTETTATTATNNHAAYLNIGLMHVYLPDDKCQTLRVRSLPIRTTSRARECVHMLAAKLKLYYACTSSMTGAGGVGGCAAHGTSQDDYALFYMHNGHEVRVRDDERPYEIKKARNAPAMKFIFRQRSANFLWPKSIEN